MAIIKFIKSKLFVGLCLLIVLTPTAFSKPSNSLLPFGWSKIKDMSNIKAINKKCYFDYSLAYTDLDIENSIKNCPLASSDSTSDSDTPENIEKEESVSEKKIYLYQSEQFSLFLEEFSLNLRGEPISDPTSYDAYDKISRYILFLEKDNQIVDHLTVSWFEIGDSGFTDGLSFYIDKKFNIFIINHGVTDLGDWLRLWAHYKIDLKNLKFEAIKVKTESEQMNFPDNLIVFANSNYDKNSVQRCKQEFNTECNNQNTYKYYFNEVKKNTTLLVKKSQASKNAFSLFKKKLDRSCLTMPRFDYIKGGPFSYFHDLYSCEIEGLKQELIRIEKELAKK
ncbi:hypothetical protein DKK70_08350 [Gilliamella apicola]|uniref:Uncharacterized protein n=1 Tax=Gilliamella apicola TaxID=1196095 RepID=A0A2V4E7V7_9GAMM|nr:hypothetical protein [Gilliamella apicola]PXZ06996.1 hypothetical protein DKK70_08350 [Gilliamella apicola]